MNRIASTTVNNTVRQNAVRYNNTSSQQSISGSTIFGVILLIIIIMAFISSAYWLYNYYKTRSFMTPLSVEVLTDITDATNKTNIAAGIIPNSTYSNEYSISFWINITDYNYNYGNEKVIMRRGTAGSGNPEIVLDANKNDLIFRVKLQAGTPTAAAITIPITTISAPTTAPTTVPTTAPTTAPTTVPTTAPTTTGTSSFTDIPLQNSDCGRVAIGKEEPYYTYGKFTDENNKASFKVGDNTIDYPTIQYTMGTGVNSEIINNLKFMPHNDTVSTSTDYFSLISGNNIESGKETFNDSLDTSANKSTNSSNSSKLQSVSHFINTDSLAGTCVARMIPLQKWVSVIVSVNNQVVDIYIDGQLTSSCVLQGFPAISTDSVEITPNGGFSGSISRVKFMNTAMTIQNARSIYYDGPIKTIGLIDLISSYIPEYIVPWFWWTVIIIVIILIVYAIAF